MSKQQELESVIADLRSGVPDVRGVVVTTPDGLPLAHDLPPDQSEMLAALAASAINSGDRVSTQLGLGALVETTLKAEHGQLVAYRIGHLAIVVIAAPLQANIGLLRIEARAAAVRITSILR